MTRDAYMQGSAFVPNETLCEAAQRLVQAKRHAILLVEDTAAHAALVRRALDADVWEIEHVTRGSDALRSFERDPTRIVLLDLSLPDTDGLQLLVRMRAIYHLAAIVVVTATDNLNVSVDAMRKGAWDYVVKGDPQASLAQICSAIARAWEQRIKLAENELMEKTKIVELVRAQRLEAIETVVRTVCHEVNNPLSGVVALSQLLAQYSNCDNEVQRLAEGISRSAQQVAEVVQKLREIGDQPVSFGGRTVLSIDAVEQTDSVDKPKK